MNQEKPSIAIVIEKEEDLVFTYKGKTFTLTENFVPNTRISSDIVTIWLTETDEDGIAHYIFVHYFYGTETIEYMVETAIGYIDDYLKENDLDQDH